MIVECWARLSRVDLPLPEVPTKAHDVPAGTLKEVPRRMGCPSRYANWTSWNSMSSPPLVPGNSIASGLSCTSRPDMVYVICSGLCSLSYPAHQGQMLVMQSSLQLVDVYPFIILQSNLDGQYALRSQKTVTAIEIRLYLTHFFTFKSI